jgi:hypothetical protein
MDTYGSQYVICNDDVLPLRVAIITQRASKPDGLESYRSDVKLTTTSFEKYHPRNHKPAISGGSKPEMTNENDPI